MYNSILIHESDAAFDRWKKKIKKYFDEILME